jgi:DNA (cytosine-5)-methyltransferase 1
MSTRGRRPVILDLFCGAGGASMGYHSAGFDVVGVDITSQPNYPFSFVQADVMTLNLTELAVRSEALAIHASPPCQHYSPLAAYHGDRGRYPDLVGEVQEMLRATGAPYVIENVPQAPLIGAQLLCGAMFTGLRIYRHRAFETNFSIRGPDHPEHVARCARNGYLPAPNQFMSIHGGKHSKAWQRKAAEVNRSGPN